MENRVAGKGAYIILALVTLLPAGTVAYYLYRHLGKETFYAEAAFWLTVLLLAELLAGLLLVARWFQRLASNSDIEELRKAAYSYRLGGTLALRPFLNSEGETLDADSSLADYRAGIIEPNFYKTPTNPTFFLAVALVVSLGLFAFFAPKLNLLTIPVIPLLGPELGGWDWRIEGDVDRSAFIAYGAGALVCLAFAFAGAFVWAVIYLTRRMAMRDVTAHTYQEVTMRLVASSIIALVVYHIFASTEPSATMPWGELLMVLAFGTGVMPETVLRWVGNKAARLFGAVEQNDHIDLEHIQGISAFTRARLVEVGIYDAQGMISNNPLRLALQTPFSLPQVMDWYGQCFLLLYFRPKGLDALRNLGVRTVWELKELSDAAENTFADVKTNGDATIKIPQVLKVIDANANFIRATEIQLRMREGITPERAVPQAA
jgi:hypothetical protein